MIIDTYTIECIDKIYFMRQLQTFYKQGYKISGYSTAINPKTERVVYSAILIKKVSFFVCVFRKMKEITKKIIGKNGGF